VGTTTRSPIPTLRWRSDSWGVPRTQMRWVGSRCSTPHLPLLELACPPVLPRINLADPSSPSGESDLSLALGKGMRKAADGPTKAMILATTQLLGRGWELRQRRGTNFPTTAWVRENGLRNGGQPRGRASPARSGVGVALRSPGRSPLPITIQLTHGLPCAQSMMHFDPLFPASDGLTAFPTFRVRETIVAND
jgi:hypothetical protein